MLSKTIFKSNLSKVFNITDRLYLGLVFTLLVVYYLYDFNLQDYDCCWPC